MDWSRAKTILIISFIVLNIFLAAQINNTIEEKSLFVQTGNIPNTQIQKLLKENHVKMTAKPDNVLEATPLVAQITQLSTGWTQDERGYYIKTFTSPLFVENERHFNQILKKHVPSFQSYQEYAATPQNRLYLQYENNMPIFDGKLIVSLTKDRKIHAIQLLHYHNKPIKKIQLLSFNSALYNLLYSDELSRFSKPTITKAILGYNARSNPSQTDNYYLMPYWRFIVNEGQYVDVNALSGNIERVEQS